MIIFDSLKLPQSENIFHYYNTMGPIYKIFKLNFSTMKKPVG